MSSTLVHLLEARASELPNRSLFHFLTDGEVDGPWERMSATALAEAARAIGAQLATAGAFERPVLILMPPGLEFVRAFFGCLYAGAVAVPVYPPEPGRLERGVERLRRVVESSGARVVMTTAALAPAVEALLGHVQVLASDQAPAAPEFEPRLGEVALLQYTSGSTQAPRGVVLGHEQLLENSRQIAQAFRTTSEMRLVSWLPPYHDMGLIGGVLQPLFLGAEVLGMSPLHFLQRPRRWLEAISRFRANTSGGPNFAFDLLARRVAPQERAGLELSSWRVAFNGAEPVRAETQQRFVDAFAEHGFSASAFVPCYGLAEATLLVAAAPLGLPPKVHHVDAAALERGAVRAASGEGSRALVSSGNLAPGVELAVVDPGTRARVEPGSIGELWVRGPNVARGYFQDAERTAEVFGAELDGAGPWLRTGDLGALVEGELLVTGRLKDLMIVRGRNLYPQDVEASVVAAHSQIRTGNVVAFALADEGVCVVAEVRPEARDFEPILDAMEQALLTNHEVAPQLLVLAAPGAILKTSSGKLARAATRLALDSRELRPLATRARAAEGALYTDLSAAFRRLDARSTRYQFELERDIPWARQGEPGDYYPERLLEGYGYDIAVLRSVPGAWSLFQRRMALSIAAGFELLEEALLGFAAREARHFRGVRSVQVLCDEERKHVELFRRVSVQLLALEPDLSADVARDASMLQQALADFADERRFPSLAAYHYCWWLLVLFFEELTVWLGAELSEMAHVQPTWLAAHQAHAREETQHVLTDFACLLALNASEEERAAWSALVFDEVVPHLALAMSPAAAHRCTLERFPSLAGRARCMNGEVSPFSALLAHPAFSRTRAAAQHVARRASPEPFAAEPAPELEDFILDWAAQVLGRRPGRLESLQLAGLDSVGALSLCGALEQELGVRLPGSSVYDYPTAEKLARFARTRARATSRRSTAVNEPLLSRQRRLLALDRQHPGQVLDHLSAVFTFSVADAEQVPAALARIVTRHPGLWRRFPRDAEGGFGFEALPIDRDLPLTRVRRDFDDAALARRATELDGEPFDLERGPPFRAELWVGGERAALLLALHHVCADGWSLEILFRELAAECRGERVSGPVADGLAREQAQLASVDAELRLEHWRALLAGVPECAREASVASQTIAAASGELARGEWEQVQSAARRLSATPYQVLLTAFQLAWRRHAGAAEPLMGAHLFNRSDEAERRAVSYRVNVLMLRCEVDAETSFPVALERVRGAWLQALDQELSIDHVVRHVFPERYRERWMPARVAFNMLLTRGERDGGWRWRHDLAAKPRFLFFDGMFVVLPDPERLRFTFWYDTSAIAAREADALVLDFQSVLSNLLRAGKADRREEGAAQ